MAYVFHAAINRALAAGKVKKPAPKEKEDTNVCDKKPGSGISAGTVGP
ncbi:hypothetical protein IMZ48_44185 [Candidatus Bathyarchaeota archaeon]|nr:hypothetical protein [Candidatus Bathyarchaeota archaeon]